MSLYDDRTFENLQAEMRADLSADVDQQEGSFIDIALGKQAVRLEEAYENLDYVYDNMFCDTQDREHLIESGAEAGLLIDEGSQAVVLATVNCEVEEGTVFTALDSEYNYETGELVGRIDHETVDDDGEPVVLSYYQYQLIAEDVGVEPGSYTGDIEPADFMDDFEEGWIVGLITAGEDEEDTEAYRERRLQWFQTKACAGNRAYYKEVIKDLDNVGGVKMQRRQTGSSYIEAYIQNAEYRAAPAALLAAVKAAVDPTEYTGEGYGLAPIGHQVTVHSASETTVNIAVTLVLESGLEYEDIASQMRAKCEEYISGLREVWENESYLIVRISGLETKILEIEGVHDVSLTINGSASNLQLGTYAIPVLGTVTGSVSS